MPTTQFHRPEDVRDSIESLLGAHGNNRPFIYWSLLVVTLAALSALPIVKVDMSVGAPGQIRPAVERLVVYPAVSGRISEFLVADNQLVQAGDPLLVIDSSALQARIAQNRSERAENARALTDLQTLLGPDAWPAVLDSSPPELPEIPPLALANSPWSTGTDLSLPLATPQYLRQHAVLQSNLARLSLQRSKVMHDLVRSKSLYEKGLITQQEFEQQDYAVQTVEREFQLLVQQTLSRWQSERLERELKDTALESEREQLAQQATLYTVRAPINGTAIGFTGLHTGLFLPAEQRIGEISPTAALQADVYLSPRDVGFVKTGQPTKLQIDAFPYTEWGTITGQVRSISQDFVQLGQQIAFKAVVDLDATQLQSATGTLVDLRRGMTVRARFVLQRRTLFNVLFGKMSDSLDPRANSPTT